MPPQDARPLSPEELTEIKAFRATERRWIPGTSDSAFIDRALATIEGQAEEIARLREWTRVGNTLDNHHNAEACPYCNPDKVTFKESRTQAQELARLRASRSTNDDGTTGTAEAVRELREGSGVVGVRLVARAAGPAGDLEGVLMALRVEVYNPPGCSTDSAYMRAFDEDGHLRGELFFFTWLPIVLPRWLGNWWLRHLAAKVKRQAEVLTWKEPRS